MKIICAHCKSSTDKPKGHVTRALKIGAPMYCNKICFGLAHRVDRSIEEKKRIKYEYDKQRRADKAELIKAKQKAYNESPAGREMQRRHREKRKEYHKKYINSERYRKWKHEYDKVHVAKNKYGEFYESAIILNQIETVIQPERFEAKKQKGLINKSQKRKRVWNLQPKI